MSENLKKASEKYKSQSSNPHRFLYGDFGKPGLTNDKYGKMGQMQKKNVQAVADARSNLKKTTVIKPPFSFKVSPSELVRKPQKNDAGLGTLNIQQQKTTMKSNLVMGKQILTS